MTYDPSRPDPADGHKPRRRSLVTIAGALALLVAVVVLLGLWGTTDSVDDTDAIVELPPDPTEMRNQEVPAATGSTVSPTADPEVPAPSPAEEERAAPPLAGPQPAPTLVNPAQ